MADAMNVLNNIIREELPFVIHESLPEIAPIFSSIQQTSENVIRDKGIGRGWKVEHLFNTGIAGLLEYGAPGGPDMTSITGSQVGLLAQGSAAANLAIFPTATESPHGAELKRELTLHKMVGNFSLPATWMQADALTATQIKKVARDVKAVGQLRALIEAASFFSHNVSDGTYDVKALGRISSIAEVTPATNYVDITIDEEYGRIHNFRVGMRIDITADSAGVIQTGTATDGTDVRNYAATNVYVQLLVTSVDYLSKVVRVVGINSSTGAVAAYASGDWGSGQAAAADDWIVLANCSKYTAGARPIHSWGLNDWTKSSGTIMGGAAAAEALDLDTYHQFKSQVVAVNAPLTDDVLNRYIAGFMDAYPGSTIDSIITTQGVTQKYIEQPSLYNNRQVFDRTGKALKLVGGWAMVEYAFNGKMLNWVISPMCLKKTLYGCKLAGGNLKRYVPPRIGGSDNRVGAEIEFLAPLGGHTGIFKIAHASSGAPQDLVEAPFWQYVLRAPVDVKGVKLTGLTESTLT
jgi:hypothetical protein